MTVVALSRLVSEAVAAADELAAEGIEVEVIDPRTLVPLDLEAIVESVSRTHRLVVAHEAVLHGGFGAEIAAQVQEAAFDELDAPIARVGAPFQPVPFSPPLEDAYLPGRAEVVAAVRTAARPVGPVRRERPLSRSRGLLRSLRFAVTGERVSGPKGVEAAC